MHTKNRNTKHMFYLDWMEGLVLSIVDVHWQIFNFLKLFLSLINKYLHNLGYVLNYLEVLTFD